MATIADQKAAAGILGAQNARRVVEERFPDYAAIAAAQLAPFKVSMTHEQLADHFGMDVARFDKHLEPSYAEGFVSGVEHQFFITAMRAAGVRVHTTEVPLT